jgi:hypothetical protein
MVEVPDELIYLVFPCLREVEESLVRLGKKARASMLSIREDLKYLAVVVVQDAFELTDDGPGKYIFNDHPVHQMLIQSSLFR